MTVWISLFGGVALCSWVVALVSWLAAVGHRRPEIPLSHLLLKGTLSFDPNTFTEAGRPHQRRFLVAAGVFFICALGGIAVAVVASGGQPDHPVG